MTCSVRVLKCLPGDIFLQPKHVGKFTLLNILLCFWLNDFLFTTTAQRDGFHQICKTASAFSFGFAREKVKSYFLISNDSAVSLSLNLPAIYGLIGPQVAVILVKPLNLLDSHVILPKLLFPLSGHRFYNVSVGELATYWTEDAEVLRALKPLLLCIWAWSIFKNIFTLHRCNIL